MPPFKRGTESHIRLATHSHIMVYSDDELELCTYSDCGSGWRGIAATVHDSGGLAMDESTEKNDWLVRLLSRLAVLGVMLFVLWQLVYLVRFSFGWLNWLR